MSEKTYAEQIREIDERHTQALDSDGFGKIDAFVDLEFLARKMADRIDELQRIVDLVNATNTVIKPATLTFGRVVVLDGRTGKDACERTALEGIEALFAEADGGESPKRLSIGVER